MNKLVCIFFLTICKLFASGQEIYYQSFDHINITSDSEFIDANYATNSLWKAEVMKLTEENISIVPSPLANTEAKCLKLILNPKDSASSGHRSEITFSPKRESGVYFYSWKFLFPENFDDDDLMENKEEKYENIIIGQWHNGNKVKTHSESIPNYRYDDGEEGNMPPPVIFSLIVSDNPLSKHRDLGIAYGLYYTIPEDTDEFDLYKRQNQTIENAIKIGEWNTISMEINWSANSDGYMNVWINTNPNNVPSAAFSGPNQNLFGDWKDEIEFPITNCNETYENEEEMPKAEPRCNYFKVGMYKGKILEDENEESDVMYIDEFHEVRTKEDLNWKPYSCNETVLIESFVYNDLSGDFIEIQSSSSFGNNIYIKGTNINLLDSGLYISGATSSVDFTAKECYSFNESILTEPTLNSRYTRNQYEQVDSITNQTISVETFPNPNSGSFHINQNIDEAFKLELFDLNGNEVPFNQVGNRIELVESNSKILIYRISTSDIKIGGKIIVLP